MQIFCEYQIQDTLHGSIKNVLDQWENFTQNSSIIFKLLKAKYPTVKTLARLKHEYLIRSNFNHESLGALTAGVAREIRNPLKCVNNYPESSVKLTEELLEWFEQKSENLYVDTLDYIKHILIDILDNNGAINPSTNPKILFAVSCSTCGLTPASGSWQRLTFG